MEKKIPSLLQSSPPAGMHVREGEREEGGGEGEIEGREIGEEERKREREWVGGVTCATGQGRE
jgi:hypothetical protein